jgi:hypothetical protein
VSKDTTAQLQQRIEQLQQELHKVVNSQIMRSASATPAPIDMVVALEIQSMDKGKEYALGLAQAYTADKLRMAKIEATIGTSRLGAVCIPDLTERSSYHDAVTLLQMMRYLAVWRLKRSASKC